MGLQPDIKRNTGSRGYRYKQSEIISAKGECSGLYMTDDEQALATQPKTQVRRIYQKTARVIKQGFAARAYAISHAPRAQCQCFSTKIILCDYKKTSHLCHQS